MTTIREGTVLARLAATDTDHGMVYHLIILDAEGRKPLAQILLKGDHRPVLAAIQEI